MGMTYSQFKQLLKKYPSKQYSDTSFYGIVFDNKKNKIYIAVSNNNSNKTKVVKSISTCSSDFKTKDGVREGISIEQLLKIYSHITISKSTDDDSEHITLQSYKNISLLLDSNDHKLLGNYYIDGVNGYVICIDVIMKN